MVSRVTCSSIQWWSPPLAVRVFLLVVSGAILGNALSPLASVSPRDAVKISADDPYRLKRTVTPNQYNLYLEPDLDNEVFEGRVEISVTVEEATDTISLHAEGLELSQVTVARQDEPGTKLDSTFSTREQYELIDIVFSENLLANENYIISIDYKGKLRDNFYGFFVSKYYNGNIEKKLAATQFQATHARKAFPCFDEPSFKARFQVTIIAPPGYHCLGNMPIYVVKDLSNNRKEFSFQNSVKMSSYLLAFVVSDFESRGDNENDIPGEVALKTWTRPNAIEGSEYSLSVARPMLKVLEDYTGIHFTDDTQPTPFNKIDQVALPGYHGAMENWGLITYGETALLYNDGSADAKMFVAIVIAHELAHMWFGNLITTHWWDTTWLNEGFARFFQYYAVDKVETEWRMWDQFVVDEHQMVFALDSVATAQPLTHDASTPGEVSASFGRISYNKGGSLLRMISNMIGPVNFQRALQNYLNSNKYETVVPENLFESLKPFAGATHLSEDDFEAFLKSWTEQAGFPVVHVNRNYDSNTATLSQKRFLFKGESSEQYYVPLTWTIEGRSFAIWQPDIYLTSQSSMLELDGMPSEKFWVIFNVQETGYYRVNYDVTNWKLITTFLKNIYKSIDEIHLLNRAQLLDDAFNLARANYLSYEIAFDLADYLERETDYIPWSSALTSLSYLKRLLVNDIRYPMFKRYVLRLLDRIFERFDFNVPERHVEKLLLNKIATWACALDHQKCLDTAVNMLQLYIEDDISIPADLRSVVYCYGIYSGNDNYWDSMWEKYKNSLDEAERELILTGLGCSSQEHRLKTLLAHSISGVHIRKEDTSSVFAAVYSNPRGVETALEFLDENFNSISNYFGSMGDINSIVSGIAGRLTTVQQKEKLENFIQRYEDQLGATGNAALESVDENLQWLSIHQDNIFSILQNIEFKHYRLPLWVTPVDYSLWLEPDISHDTFVGEVTINVVALAPTDKIILHSQGLLSSKIVVLDPSNLLYNNLYGNHSYDEHLDFLTLYLRKTLTPSQTYVIQLTFSGTLRDDMYGFYISSYVNENGDMKKLAATQFQPTYARRAFPSFDEPHFKATFTLSVRTPPYYRTIGNMPVWYTRVWDDFTSEVIFFTTPKMSTYLLALVVSDFQYVEEPTSADEIVFRTWARSNALDWAEYSLQVSRPLLETLEDITGIDYIDKTLANPFDKVDQVAVPDFSAGAMENWGLITYRETALLYNDGTASARKSVATIIAHELTHMWFGNLVTTYWWDTTWLNEGFAQYYQFFATSVVKPDWRLMDQFLVDHHQGVFASDSLTSSAALTAPAYTPAQVSARFGTITYSKGASVLRMLSAVMGEQNFQIALQTYLNAHRYSTTTPSQLFTHLIDKSAHTNLDEISFEKFLISWTEQSGFPVVMVYRNYEGGSATISQSRFLLKSPQSPDPTLYYVPLTWVGPGGDFSDTAPKSYLPQQRSTTVSGLPAAEEWVIFNVQETGYYRVNYDDSNWKLLSDYLLDASNRLDDIHVLNRAQLLDDAFNLGRAGQLQYAIVFDLADYLQRETDFIPWASAFAAFSYLQRMLIHNDEYKYFETYVRNLLEERYEHFNFQDQEGHIDKLFLNRVSAWACSLQHSHCTNAARTALEGFLGSEAVPADLRSVVYCYGIRHSSQEHWYKLLDKYKESSDSAERALLMAGLACSHDEELLNELLHHSISGTFIRKQDASSVFSSVYSNSKGVEVALNFLDENFEAVQQYYGSMGAINNIVVGIAGRLTTVEQRQKIETFVEKHSDDLGATAATALETVDENLGWLQKHGEVIIELLEDRVGGAGSLRATVVAVLALVLTVRLL